MGSIKIRSIVGIGGKCGAGKSILTACFARHGYHVIDVDKIGHTVLIEQSAQVIACFGDTITDAAHTISRRKLGALVFGDPSALQRLNNIIHPTMKQEVMRQIHALHPHNVVIDAALLCYLELDIICNTVIWVQSSLIRRFLRVYRRDNLSFFATWHRVCSQQNLTFKSGGIHADMYVVNNNMSKHSLMNMSEKLFHMCCK